MKKKAIGIAAVILVLAAGFFAYTVLSARGGAAEAVASYNAAAEGYNEAIAPYNEAAAGIADANSRLQGVLDTAQAVFDRNEAAYEPDTRDQLESAIQKAGKAFVETPALIDPFEVQEVPVSFNTKDLANVQQEAEAALSAVKEAGEKIPPVPRVSDYTAEIKAVETAQKKYEDSVQKLANITAPSDDFVQDRLEKIKTVVESQAVTADHDPNGLLGKEGGYIGCVYFLDERVDRSLLPREAFEKEKDKDEKDGEEASEGSTGDSAESSTESTAGEASDAAAEDASSTAGTEASAAESGTTAGTALAEAQTGAALDTAATAESGTTAENRAAEAQTGTEAESAAVSTGTSAAESGTTAAETAATEAQTGAAAETAAAGETKKKKENTIDVVMIGTVGGGAVEIFATEEEAAKRAEYISFFDGSVMAAGPCSVEGTLVIRASKYLAPEDQQKLLKEVRDALMAVE